MAEPKERIIPFFLPMQGCPAQCVFCDQSPITGEAAAPTPAEVAAAIDGAPAELIREVAFYGGSFTCLPRTVQDAYLDAVAPHLASGKVGGIRISTRPDGVDAAVCARLKERGVVTVELGVQSFDDGVLSAAGRGCDGDAARRGCKAVTDAGMTLGVQLMTGLPGDTREKDAASMKEAIRLGAALVRVYPTLVLAHTPLAAMYEKGIYQPQTLDEAVAVCCDMREMTEAAGIPVIRMGLNPSRELEAALIAGPYHPSFGALVREELRSRQMAALVEAAGYDGKSPAILRCGRAEVALVYGQKKNRYIQMGQKWPAIALAPDASLANGVLELLWQGKVTSLSETEYCRRRWNDIMVG